MISPVFIRITRFSYYFYIKKLVSDVFVDDIERTKKAVMNEHFSKPLAMEKVIEAIGNYSKKITKI